MRRYSDDKIAEAIEKASSWRQVCEMLGAKPATGSQSNIKRRAILLGLDFTHFCSGSWNKGKKRPTVDIQKWLSLNSGVPSDRLKKRLFLLGIKEKACESCGVREWLGHVAPLELDHKNSDHYDNRLDNLQILCANCHSVVTSLRRVSGGTVDTLGLDPSAKA